MAIDTTVPGSPGDWMVRLWKQLAAEQPRLKRLDAYRTGKPPLVLGSEAMRSAFYRFQNVAHTNFADLIASAVTDRQAVRSIRTAATDDDDGDVKAWAIWAKNNLDVYSSDVHYDAASLGKGYASVGFVDGEAVIVPEDPREVTHAADELNPMDVRAGFKLFHDTFQSMDYAVLWLKGDANTPGQRWVAYRSRKARLNSVGAPVTISFSPASFTMAPFDPDSDVETLLAAGVDESLLGEPDAAYTGLMSQTYTAKRVPLIPFVNRKGIGEFETHTDLIDRIHHILLQQVVIITLQAFKQRAIVLDPSAGEDGQLPTHDDAGNKIDYDDLFSSSPGSLWTLPVGAKIWESTEANLQSILAAAKDSIQQLAAVTKTPFTMFSSDAVNSSAEGAQLSREQLVFKVEDRNKIFGRSWALALSIAFEFENDVARSSVSEILVDWTPAERFSLQEKATADAAAVSLSDEQKYRVIWGMTPAEAAIATAQKNAQNLREAALKITQAAPQIPVASDQPAA